jgi:hypothetical protein
VFEIHPALALGVQRPVEVDVEERAQGRGRVAVSPVIATDPEPDVELAITSQLAIEPTTPPPATIVRVIAGGSVSIFASCSKKACRSRDGNAAMAPASLLGSNSTGSPASLAASTDRWIPPHPSAPVNVAVHSM